MLQIQISPNTPKDPQILGFSKRNFRRSPIASKKNVPYISFILSRLESAATVRDPTVKCQVSNLESIQRKAARWINTHYDWDHDSEKKMIMSNGKDAKFGFKDLNNFWTF